MPTKTTKKPPTRKPSAPKATKAHAVHKPAAPAKAKPAKKTAERKPVRAHETPAPKKTEVSPPPAATPKLPPAPSHHAPESVSLIDTKPAKKTEKDGEIKKKSKILPPISRLLEPPKIDKFIAQTQQVAPPQPQVTVGATDDGTIAPEASAEEQAEEQKVIHIKPPIIVKQLASALELKPHQLIAELMNFNIFANINQTIEPDIASKIAESHGFVLEK